MSAAAPTPGRNMGQPIPRVDGYAKVTGQARYASDVPHARAAYGYLVMSDAGRGNITAIDDSAARAVPGVLDVMTHLNRPPVGKAKGMQITEVVPLDGPEVHHDGQIIGFITADTYDAAREAAHRMVVRYDREEPTATFGSPGVDKQLTEDVAKDTPQPKEDPHLGDAEAELARSAYTIDARYGTPTQHHNAMELFTTTASWNGDELTIDEPSQFVFGLRSGVAQQLGMDREKVHVRSEYLGGAFGGKGSLTHRTVLVALAARRVGRPVKLVSTRHQGFTISGNRAETRHHIRMGTDAAGQDHRAPFRHLGDRLAHRQLRERRCGRRGCDVRLPRRPEHRAAGAGGPQHADVHALATGISRHVRARVRDG